MVRNKREFCYACPIFTYSGRATTKQGVIPAEHSIVHSSGKTPQLLPHENGITKRPIVINMAPGEKILDIASRIYFGIHHPIQYNVKVKDIGHMPNDLIPTLIANWKEEDDRDKFSRQSTDVTELAGVEEEEEEKPTDPYLYHATYNPKGYHPHISAYSYHPTHNLYGWHETQAPECYHPEHNKEGFHYMGNPSGYHSVSNPYGYHSRLAPDNYHPEFNPHAHHPTNNPYGYSRMYYNAYHPIHNPFGYHYLHNKYGYDPTSNPTAYHPKFNPAGTRPPPIVSIIGDITQGLQNTTL